MLCPVSDATTDARPWWRLPDTPVPGGVPELARALLWAELAIVLLLSLGRSAVYSVVSIISALTAPGALSAQAANLNNSLAPDRPWLDLTYQLLRVVFALVPVALAAYLLVRSGTRVRDVWAGGGRWAAWGDLGRGAWLALGVGTVGVVFYLATFALGTNLTVVAQSLPGEWWRVPVLVLAAAQNALLEELVVLGFVQVRLRQLGLGDSAAIGCRAAAGELPPLPGPRRVRRQRRDGPALRLALPPLGPGRAVRGGPHAARRRRLRRVRRPGRAGRLAADPLTT